jgi:hypothetical protein
MASFWRFLDHTQRRITVGRTSLDEWSARRRDLYLTTLNTGRHPCPGGIRTHSPSKRAALDPHIKPSRVSAPFSCSYRTWQHLAKERALIVGLPYRASLHSAACSGMVATDVVTPYLSDFFCLRTTSASCSGITSSKKLSAYVHAKTVDFVWISSRLGLPHLVCSSGVERKSILFVHEKVWSP